MKHPAARRAVRATTARGGVWLRGRAAGAAMARGEGRGGVGWERIDYLLTSCITVPSKQGGGPRSRDQGASSEDRMVNIKCPGVGESKRQTAAGLWTGGLEQKQRRGDHAGRNKSGKSKNTNNTPIPGHGLLLIYD